MTGTVCVCVLKRGFFFFTKLYAIPIYVFIPVEKVWGFILFSRRNSFSIPFENGKRGNILGF